MFKKDNFSLGFLIGIILPIPVAIVLALILRIFQKYLQLVQGVQQIDMLLLSLAANLIWMRYLFVKSKADHSGRGLLLATVAWAVVFFIFLKNSNLTLF
jgi:uncharacterized BrkB/YihY/UPF0761 family membrane protein